MHDETKKDRFSIDFKSCLSEMEDFLFIREVDHAIYLIVNVALLARAPY